ncbi:MAG: T9SS type A sorting domain-containing protein [Bacteroidetes bacterium]|nr:T9SS type A sorting domain-containing protein [Bacteroidota bacterium]
MRFNCTNFRFLFSTVLFLLLLSSISVFAADPTISDIKIEVLKHNDETESQYVKITYTAKDFDPKGSIVKLLAECKGNVNFSERPIASELSGDVGLVVGDGQKTILWEDEKTLIRLGKQDKFTSTITLSIEGSDGNISAVSLNISKYKDAAWYYFNTGLVRMTIDKMTWANPEFPCNPLGNNWHNANVPFGANYYKVKTVTDFPVYKGRNPSDKFRGECTEIGCSSVLAIKDYGQPSQVIWANFTKRFVKTVDVNGTNVTQDFEFQFRYYEKTADGTKSLSVVNAGKQGQQITSELNLGETIDLTLDVGKIGEVKSNTFEIEVPRREWKYFYKGNHIFTVKVSDKKASFKGLSDGKIALDGGEEVMIGEAIKFKGASFIIDTTPGKSSFNFLGACVTNGVVISSGVNRTINLKENLELPTPWSVSESAPLYLAGIAPFIDRLRLEGDANAPTGVLFDIRLIFKTFSDGCDILFHPSDNTGGIVFKDVKISSSGWELPPSLQVNNVGIPKSKDWCIKNMTIAYEKPNKKFSFDILLKAPLFSDIGAGCTFIDNGIEQFKILAKLGSGGIPVPIPEPPPAHVALWRGVELEMSNWQTGPKTLRGTMFFANRDDWNQIGAFRFVKDAIGDAPGWQIFEAEGTLQGNEFGEFTVDGKIRFFGKIDIWGAQLRGGFSLALNFYQPLIYLGLNNLGIDVGQLGGDKFLISGTINGSANVLPQFVLSGSIRGDIYIPDLFKNHPAFQLINSKLGLPLKVTSGQMMIRNTQGSFDLDLGWLGTWGAWIDVSKSPFTETRQFIGIQSGNVKNLGGIAFKTNGNKKQASDTTYVPFTINVPTNYAYVEIKADVQPLTVLISPSQKIFTSTTSDSLVIFSPAASTADVGLWVLKNPELGDWKLGVIGKKNGDSIHIWSIIKPRTEFSFTSNQIVRTVFCNWDNSKASDKSIIEFYIDTDDKGNDGYRIGTVDEKTGSFSYTLTDSLKECGYYIYAVRWDGDRATNFVYSSTYLTNPKVGLVAPSNGKGTYTTKNIVNLNWVKSADPNASFYTIKVTDETGKDSIYATTSADATGIQLTVENPSSKTFSIQTNGANQATGCWAKFPQLVLGVQEEYHLVDNSSIEIVPNPTDDMATIHFNQVLSGKVIINVVDLLGRNRLQFEGGIMQTGVNSVQLELSNLEQGTYLVRVVSGSSQFSTLMTVIR